MPDLVITRPNAARIQRCKISSFMIFPATIDDIKEICVIINDGATAYKGVIPADRWREPYMPEDELKGQIAQGVVFYKYLENDAILGVMGIQDKGAVTLVRHAYVRSSSRNKGIGGKLLQHLLASTVKPVLIGTWA